MLDYSKLLKPVKESKKYTKEETVKYLSELAHLLITIDITNLFNDEVVKAIKSNLKGNMEEHLKSISVYELVEAVNASSKLKKAVQSKKNIPLNYTQLVEILIEYMKDGKKLSAIEIKKYLNEKTGVKLTAGKWASLRKKFPFEYNGQKYNLKIAEGTKAQSKWHLIKA